MCVDCYALCVVCCLLYVCGVLCVAHDALCVARRYSLFALVGSCWSLFVVRDCFLFVVYDVLFVGGFVIVFC